MYVEIPQDHLDEFEKKNVHQVYQAIAPHFSATRYKVGASVTIAAVKQRVDKT